MTDTYLQPEVHIVITQSPGVDGITSAARLAQIEADLAALELRPNISILDDVPDVDATGVDDGNVLAWNSATSQWEVTPIVSGLTSAIAAAGTTVLEPVNRIQEGAGIKFNPHPTLADMLRIGVNVGTAAGTVAAGDHAHTGVRAILGEFVPTGYLSGGTRQLVSTTVTLLAGIEYLVEATLKVQVRGGDEGPCRYRMTVLIDGGARTSPSGTNGAWSVQGVPDHVEWVNARTRMGFGNAITISASVEYDSGGGTYFDHGGIEIRLTPNR